MSISCSGNHASPWGVYCTIIRHCCVNSLTFCVDEGMKEYIREIINGLQTNTILQFLTLYVTGFERTRLPRTQQESPSHDSCTH